MNYQTIDSTITTTMRKGDLQQIADVLTTQRSRRWDGVVPSTKMRMHLGVLHLTGTDPVINDDGVTLADGQFWPTSIFDEGVAAKLNIPVGFLRRMRAERIDLYDAVVNGLLHGRKEKVRINGAGEVYETILAAVPADPRSFLIRCYTGVDGKPGVARALLSDSYKIGMDNLDVVVAALEGLTEAGITKTEVEVDLSERRMALKVHCPDIAVMAPTLLEGYRNPWGRTTEAQQRWLDHGGFNEDAPVIFAGLVISNSETGNGAWTVDPQAKVLRCLNGLTLDVLAKVRSVHIGGKLEEGTIDWSLDTQQKQAAVIRAKTRDAVVQFTNRDWLAAEIAKLEAKIKPVEDAQKVITVVAKQLTFTDEQAKGILDHFILGGQLNTAGVMNAVTSYAQTVEDPDVANNIEAQGVRALHLAAAIA